MKMKNKVALALTLALGSMAAQAQDKGMDISLSTTPRAPAAAAAPVPAASAANGAGNQQALAPVKPATTQAFPAAAPAPKAAPANMAPVRVEPQKPVAPAQLAIPAPRAAQPAPVATLTAPAVRAASATPGALAAPAAHSTSVAPSISMSGDTNPFTGKQLDIEARQAQIESAKLDTDLMVERLKQANLLADLTYLPLKKKAEVTTMPGVLAAANTSAKPAASEEAPRKAVKKSRKKSVAKPAPAVAPVVKAPEPKISLTGISINGEKVSVILEVEGGGVFSASQGELTPYGRVRVVDGRSVVIGERHMTIRDSTLARMYVSDAAPVDEKIKNNMVITAPPAAQPTGANIPLPPLPPLPKAAMPRAPTPVPSR